jgi:hypothetical protein
MIPAAPSSPVPLAGTESLLAVPQPQKRAALRAKGTNICMGTAPRPLAHWERLSVVSEVMECPSCGQMA